MAPFSRTADWIAGNGWGAQPKQDIRLPSRCSVAAMSSPKDDYDQQELEAEYENYGEAQKRELGIWTSASGS